ncbi:MAG: hypothetical protein A2046_00510 [Bacteroidetes bacterium GWA2_30_7]|nr:MAG: hypothetical protein A2046_00510 [Bacteroidetes bacterium GWA2_30_7]
MKILLDVKDNKATFFMELLQNFRYVKAKPINSDKALLIEELSEAVEEINLIKAGKKQARNADDFINEL